MNYGLIDLVSEDEDAPPINPPLEIAGMEMIENEEDVFNHGYGVDGGDSSWALLSETVLGQSIQI